MKVLVGGLESVYVSVCSQKCVFVQTTGATYFLKGPSCHTFLVQGRQLACGTAEFSMYHFLRLRSPLGGNDFLGKVLGCKRDTM